MEINKMKINKELLYQAATQAGLELVGVASPRPFHQLEQFLETRAAAGYQTPFTIDRAKKRTDPRETLPQVKSLVAVGMCYAPSGVGLSKGDTEPTGGISGSKSAGLSGCLAAFAQGEDYHQVLRGKLTLMLELWQKGLGREITWTAQVDTGPLADRAAAWQAGLGWYGKNCNIINPQKGSWLVLGTVLTDVEMQADTPVEQRCGDCHRCLDACPTGALEEGGRLNAYRCVSYLTQSTGLIPRDLRKGMGDMIYGCDLCQKACPHNNQVGEGPTLEGVDLEHLLRLSNREFTREWGKSTAGWRGKKVLQRNSLVALGNSGQAEAVPLLLEGLQRESPELRAHAAWALGNFPLPQVSIALEEALKKEQVSEVREEISLALSQIFHK